MSQWSVYIVRCADKSLYTGITTDVTRRIEEHNKTDKKSAAYTRARRPVVLLYQEQHSDRSSASKREAEIKKMTKIEKEKLIAN